ncbi:MAG: KTSC domain-containing protein [Kiritimatiellae bacterium]|nr:KTSC domain-containing protein [Kiritimatiellia bacterium]
MNGILNRWTMVAALAAAAAWACAAEEVRLESSWLDRAGYDARTRTLTIRMKNSSDVYEFQGVPEEVFREFLAAESKGSYFASKIQNEYPTVRR